MGNLAADQIREANTVAGDVVKLVNVGGIPGMPAVDGSLLTNVGAGGTGPGAAVNPGELMFGNLLNYGFKGGQTAGEVQYVRLRLAQGVQIGSMRVFINSGGSGSRNIRAGLYSQLDPADPNQDPLNRVAQTASTGTNVPGGTYLTMLLLGGTYVVPTTGYYWLALIADSASLKFAVSTSMRANFLPVRRQASSSTNLPAQASALSNPISALALVAAVEA